jgi:hypothetical protein
MLVSRTFKNCLILGIQRYKLEKYSAKTCMLRSLLLYFDVHVDLVNVLAGNQKIMVLCMDSKMRILLES